jgi:hypothetical protein
MSGDWIKIEHWTQDKPEVFVMADELGIDPDAVLGKLVRIWVWADQQTFDGNAVSVTFSLLDRVSGQKGFADALLKAGWLKRVDDGVQFVNFDRHNGETAKTRALTAKRVKKHRSGNGVATLKDGIGNADGVTLTLPEKRREEKNVATNRDDQNAKPEHLGGIDDVIIPKKMQTPECQHAAAQWMAYLDEKGLGDKRPDGAIALQAWWSQMARIGPKDFPIMVERSISGAHWSVKVLPDPTKDFAGPARVSKPTEDRNDWHQALTVCRRYPSGSQQDSEERKIQMTPEQLQAARAVGFQRIAGATSYDVKQIEAEFQHAMKGAKP